MRALVNWSLAFGVYLALGVLIIDAPIALLALCAAGLASVTFETI